MHTRFFLCSYARWLVRLQIASDPAISHRKHKLNVSWDHYSWCERKWSRVWYWARDKVPANKKKWNGMAKFTHGYAKIVPGASKWHSLALSLSVRQTKCKICNWGFQHKKKYIFVCLWICIHATHNFHCIYLIWKEMHLNVNSHFQHEILRCERVCMLTLSPSHTHTHEHSLTQKWLMKWKHTNYVGGAVFGEMQMHECFIYYAALFSLCWLNCECAWCALTKNEEVGGVQR